MFTLLIALAAPAEACYFDDKFDGDFEGCGYETHRPNRLERDDGVRFEFATNALAYDAMITGGARYLTGQAPYLSVEGSSQISGVWRARATIGLDIFHGWEFLDLELGLALGAGGQWREQEIYSALSPGFEFGLGMNVGRIHTHFRLIEPLDGELITKERRWRVGFDVSERLALFGEGKAFHQDAGVTDWEKVQAYGIGAQLTL
jgi:hypothetical protein